MELIIDFDNIKDPGKKEWLLNTLKLMGISFHEAESSQALEEYNEVLENADARIRQGKFITAEELKNKTHKW